MRIHSDILTHSDINDAANAAGVLVMKNELHKSTSRKKAYDVALSGQGAYGGAYGTLPYKVALWDEWGIVLAHLFAIDPNAHTGSQGYVSGAHFHWSTDHRYVDMVPTDIHLKHDWLSGPRDMIGLYGNGAYVQRVCRCGAIKRELSRGRAWSDFAALDEPIVIGGKAR